MKLSILSALAALSFLTACQPGGATGGVSQAEFEKVKQDVDALKLQVFGDPKAKCPNDKIVDLATYGENDAPAVQDNLAEWHIENGKRSDVVTTESGLQYKIVQSGPKDGPVPEAGQIVEVNYHGFFPDGKVFDSSYQRGQPIEFPSNGVISGWVEALAGMKPCDAWTIYVPSDLAYGPDGRGSIPPNSTLIFNVQLLGVN